MPSDDPGPWPLAPVHGTRKPVLVTHDLPARDPLEQDLLEVDDELGPEEAALHLETDEWVEGRDLTAGEIDEAHYREVVDRIEPHLRAGSDGRALDFS